MKSAILGLRHRETYEELINDLNHDLIAKYPDRKASQLENSNYLSQLRGGFEEMIAINDSISRNKQKQLLLQEEAGLSGHSHHEHVINESRWRQHVPPEPAAAAEETPLRTPVGQPETYGPANMEVDDGEQRRNRKAKQRNSPVRTPERYHIGSVESTSEVGYRRAKLKLTHDVDKDAEEAHRIAIEDEESIQQRLKELRHDIVQVSRTMLEESQNKGIDEVMTGRGDKRRDEANPSPGKKKTKEDNPEDRHEPKGKPGRPKSSQLALTGGQPSLNKEEPEETTKNNKDSKQVKKTITKTKPEHGTKMQVFDTFQEWLKNEKGKHRSRQFYIDQISLRKILITKTEMKKTNINELINLILDFDREAKNI